MRITKAEKIWLAAVVIFYVIYNLPFVPAYGHAKAAFIHALISLVPLWISIYVGLSVVCRKHPLKDTHEPIEENPIEKEDSTC